MRDPFEGDQPGASAGAEGAESAAGAEEAPSRRIRWISGALRPQVRPLLLASLVRSLDGDPPDLPWPASRPLPAGAGPDPRPLERELLAGGPSHAAARSLDASVAASGVQAILTPEDGGWLARFWEEMSDPPMALFVEGTLHDPDAAAVAIVGTRHPSENGRELARTIARGLAAEGIVIVSGLALGIDAAAHAGALDVGGATVAVLGGGLDVPSPASHRDLARRIARAGALVSEFPPGCHPRPLHFPRRNRILAALAQVVLVVEGGTRSGARSTVDHALALGREVAAVPRDPIHAGSSLPNALLRCGATPVRDAADVRALLPERRGSRGIFGDSDQRLLDLLAKGSRSAELLSREAGRSEREVLASLAKLELLGAVRRAPGMRFALRRVPEPA